MIRKILVVFLLITSSILVAQRASSSPYSFFGIGNSIDARTVEQSSMGGIGVAYSHYKYLNFTNPAAYSDLRFTTYTFGILNNDLSVETDNNSQNTNTTTVDYIALAFPIGKKAGFSFGLQPRYAVGYSISNTNEAETEISLYSGNGGVSRLYGSLGMRIFKGFSLGIDAAYNFGSIERSLLTQDIDNSSSLATSFDERVEVRGASVTLGTQYKRVLKNKLTLSVGATAGLQNSLNVKGDNYLYSASILTGSLSARDTLAQNTVSGDYVIPLKTTVGAGVGKFDKWFVGVEYESRNTITTNGALDLDDNTFRYESFNKFSVGGFYLPKINSISSYFERITYRAGIRLEQTGFLVDGSGTNTNFTSIDDFGISFGLGLPLKQMSTANFGFEFGRRGSTENNLIQENYFNLRLSLSLSASGLQSWFRERRID